MSRSELRRSLMGFGLIVGQVLSRCTIGVQAGHMLCQKGDSMV